MRLLLEGMQVGFSLHSNGSSWILADRSQFHIFNAGFCISVGNTEYATGLWRFGVLLIEWLGLLGAIDVYRCLDFLCLCKS